MKRISRKPIAVATTATSRMPIAPACARWPRQASGWTGLGTVLRDSVAGQCCGTVLWADCQTPPVGSFVMPRTSRIVVPGVPHHITQRGVRRMQTFLRDGDFALYREI